MKRIQSIGMRLLVLLGPTAANLGAGDVLPSQRQTPTLDEQTIVSLGNMNTLADLPVVHHDGTITEQQARNLQGGAPEVVCMNDVTASNNATTLTCYMDDFPTAGFVFVFYECPTIANATLSDCNRCSMFSSESYGTIQIEMDACNSCTICTTTPGNLGYDCRNQAVGTCSAVDCAGECVGDLLAPTASPAPTEDLPELPCNPIGDGSMSDCQLADIPYDGLVVYFENCPNAPGATIFNCSSCFIYDSNSETTNCLDCDLCVEEMTITYDCSNLIVDDECSKRDCMDVCLHEPETDPPTGAPLVGGTSVGAVVWTGGAGSCYCAVLVAVMLGMMIV